MKILTICEQGNNRSVTFAHCLKYWKHDVIPVGVKTNSKETLDMLYKWADLIILTFKSLELHIPEEHKAKIKLFDVGEKDIYPRPFNKELHIIVKGFLDDNKPLLKP